MFDRRVIIDMARHAPLVIVGFLLIGLSGWVSFIIYRRLAQSGYKWDAYSEVWPFISTLPLAYLYLRGRKQRGWSAWPAYIVLLSAVGGITPLVVGLFRLPG
jgi:hypothetical protein